MFSRFVDCGHRKIDRYDNEVKDIKPQNVSRVACGNFADYSADITDNDYYRKDKAFSLRRSGLYALYHGNRPRDAEAYQHKHFKKFAHLFNLSFFLFLRPLYT